MSEFNKIQVYGKLFAGGQEYWVVSPHPENLDNPWDDMFERAFFGVNRNSGEWGKAGTEYQGEQLYPVPCAIIVSGTWHIELRPPAKHAYIWCEKPDLFDVDTEPEDEDVELEDLIGDYIRSNDYRDLDLDFEEDAEYYEEELEEEEALIEEW